MIPAGGRPSARPSLFGMLTRYTMGFVVLGVTSGVMLTPARRYLKNPWLWLGAAIARLLTLPNIFWEVNHQFVTLDFLESIHARDIRWGWTDSFFLNQLWKSSNPVTVPLWATGLWFLFARPEGIPLLALFLARGRDYYLASVYPMLFAAGAVRRDQGLATLNIRSAIADQINGGNSGYQLGWPDLVEELSNVRDSLPAQERLSSGILTQDDDETGAVNWYGPA